MKFLEKYKFFWECVYIEKKSLFLQAVLLGVLVFSVRIIVYNCWDSYCYYKAKSNLQSDMVGVELIEGKSKENTDLSDINGRIFWEVNKYIPTKEKNKVGQSTNHSILAVTKDIVDFFPAKMKKGSWFSKNIEYEYQGIVTPKMSRQYKVGNCYNIRLKSEEIKIKIIGVLKWNYWIGANYFGNLDESLLVYDKSGGLVENYSGEGNEIFIACEKGTASEIVDCLKERDDVIHAYELGYDDEDFKSDIEEDVTEIKFAVVLFIMSILNMILCFISFWSVNINEISIFLDNGATNREIMLFVAIKWILAYGIAYLIATVSAMWALYSVNDMLPYNDVELYLTIVFIVSVLCCFIIGYFGFIRMKRKGIALHGKDN